MSLRLLFRRFEDLAVLAQLRDACDICHQRGAGFSGHEIQSRVAVGVEVILCFEQLIESLQLSGQSCGLAFDFSVQRVKLSVDNWCRHCLFSSYVKLAICTDIYSCI